MTLKHRVEDLETHEQPRRHLVRWPGNRVTLLGTDTEIDAKDVTDEDVVLKVVYEDATAKWQN